MEPLVSIFQLQDAERRPLLAHIHQLHQDGKFKEVSETLHVVWAPREGLPALLTVPPQAGLHMGSAGQRRARWGGLTVSIRKCPHCPSTRAGLCGGLWVWQRVLGTSQPGTWLRALLGVRGLGDPHTESREAGSSPTPRGGPSPCSAPGALECSQQRSSPELWPGGLCGRATYLGHGC